MAATGLLASMLALTTMNASGETWTRDKWDACQDGSVMLKALAKQAGLPESEGRRPLVLAACGCARLALPYVMKGETRPLVAIKMAEAWAKPPSLYRRILGKKIAIKEVRDAAAHARAAADEAAASNAQPAFYAAAAAGHAFYACDSSTASYAVADAADTASLAADAIARAAADAAASTAEASVNSAAAKAKTLARCADIVRKYFPEPPATAPK